MTNLTKQTLLKLSPELDKLIDDAFSKHLKQTGEYITRSDYIRRVLHVQTSLELSEINALVIYAHLTSQAQYLAANKEALVREDFTENDIDSAIQNLRKVAEQFSILWKTMQPNQNIYDCGLV